MNCPHCGQPMPDRTEIDKALREDAGLTRETLGTDDLRERKPGDTVTGGPYRP
jgi:hypothetical protein